MSLWSWLKGQDGTLNSEQERLIAEARSNVAASEATWREEHKNIGKVVDEQLRRLEQGARVKW